jgi:hypothetical protein
MVFTTAYALMVYMAEIGIAMFGATPIRRPTRGHYSRHIGRLYPITVIGTQENVTKPPLEERTWRAINLDPFG